MNPLKTKVDAAVDRTLAKLNAMSTPAGRALALNAALENLSPGMSRTVARMTLYEGSGSSALRVALSRAITDLAVRKIDPSLGDVYDDIIAHQSMHEEAESEMDRSQRIENATGIFDMITEALDLAIDGFVEIYETVTGASGAATAAEQEAAMRSLLEQQQQASADAAAAMSRYTRGLTENQQQTSILPWVLGGGLLIAAVGGVWYATKSKKK